jgi:hypothetical protein
MADIPSLTFSITAADQVNVRGRALSRIFLSNNALKLANLFTGDVVVLSAPSQICQQKVSLHLLSENEHAPEVVFLYLEAIRGRDRMAIIRLSR